MGVDFSTFAKRQEHAALYTWARQRKKLREQGSNKIWTALIGAVVSAVLAGVATLLTGFKH